MIRLSKCERYLGIFASAVGIALLVATAAHARDSWFDEACARAEEQGRTWIEVQQGDDVVVLDCTGEIISIDDEGDPFPGEPGGSTQPGGDEPGSGEHEPGGGGSSVVDTCADCREAAADCRKAAHVFRSVCNSTGRQFANRTCAGWGPSGPQGCDGSDWPESEFDLQNLDEANQCYLVNVDATLQPVEREICAGPRVDLCVDQCMNGRAGGSRTTTFTVPVIGGIGYETSVEVSSLQGIKQACAIASQNSAFACAAKEAKCLSDNKCVISHGKASRTTRSSRLQSGQAARMRRPTEVPGTQGPATTPGKLDIKQPSAQQSTTSSAPADMAPEWQDQDLVAGNKGAARHWYRHYLQSGALSRAYERRLTLLIGHATKRYLKLHHQQTPSKAPDAGRSSKRQSALVRSTATGTPKAARRAGGTAIQSHQVEPPKTGGPTSSGPAPDQGRQFKDAASLPQVDEVFLQKAVAFLSPKQEKILLDTWPGGQLIFGSGIIRTK